MMFHNCQAAEISYDRFFTGEEIIQQSLTGGFLIQQSLTGRNMIRSVKHDEQSGKDHILCRLCSAYS